MALQPVAFAALLAIPATFNHDDQLIILGGLELDSSTGMVTKKQSAIQLISASHDQRKISVESDRDLKDKNEVIADYFYDNQILELPLDVTQIR